MMISTITFLLSLWILSVSTTLLLKEIAHPYLEGGYGVLTSLGLGFVLGVAYKVQWPHLGPLMVFLGLLNILLGPYRLLGVLGLFLYGIS